MPSLRIPEDMYIYYWSWATNQVNYEYSERMYKTVTFIKLFMGFSVVPIGTKLDDWRKFPKY